jgi:hypothetical protein
MTWHLLMTHVTVKDGERALLTRNGRLERVLDLVVTRCSIRGTS